MRVEIGLRLTEAVKTMSFWFFSISHFICGLGCGFMMTHFVPYATDIGFSELAAAGALSVMAGTNIFGILSTGVLSDRVGRKNALALTHLIRSFSFMIAIIGSGNWIIYLIAVLFGFGHFTTAPLGSGLVADLFGGLSMGSLIGLTTGAHAIGMAIGAYAGGLTYDLMQSYQTFFLILTPLSFIAATFSFLIKQKRVQP